ncbi:MAG: ABC transporter ATP-binding protein [Chloroflexaceae bacterium]
MPRGFEEDEITGRSYDWQLTRRLVQFLRPYWRQLTLALILLTGAALTTLVPPLLIQRAIDGPIATGQIEGLLPIFALYLGTLLASFGLRYAHTYIIQIVGQQVMMDLRIQIFRHIQRMSLAFFDRNPVGRLITRITNDIDALNQFLTQGIVAGLADSVTLLGIVITMLLLNWRLALISLAVLPVLAGITVIFQRLMRAAFRVTRQRLARINAYLNEQISGVLVTQLFNRETTSKTHFAQLSQDYLAANLRSLRIFAYFFPTIGFMAALATALLLYWGGQGVLANWTTLGMLVAFVQYTERAFQPIRDLAEKYTILQAAMAAAERIFWVLDTPEEVRDPEQPRQLPAPVRGEITFDNVTFGYNLDEPVLHGLSFTIPAGQAVAIVGATGAGKTSLISLLARFYDIQQGSIRLDGVDIRELPQAVLRRHVAAVPQDPVCFSGTIAGNIRLNDTTITDEQIRQAAATANAATFIERLPDGYDHEVRERGSNLSQGQRQLLAFARAIAFNPEVLLILDEATSSVDTETEALIQTALERLLQDRTSIVIAHRLSTIRHVDRIIVLHQGQIVEDGSHEELLARRGYYYRLYQLQFAGQQVAC